MYVEKAFRQLREELTKKMIVVIDYGMGNLHSVRKALEVVGAKVKVSARAEDILKAERIVFPGVGSFGPAMKELNRRKLVKPIKDAISGGKPFMGLCLGLQLLFERSEEAPGVRGLCVLKGEVKRFSF
ncbi:MAG: imidazole glycerol phosphate synthase subunit HisH, partial [Candidatus Omnitrophota bacterium]|nr:imidazole glycerol phosphate synthase subunit HisH [Candidatus Omnitrophota bacterium]